MNEQEIRRQWDAIAATYATRRDPDGSDAALIGELRERLRRDPRVLDIGPCDGARTLANLPAGSVGVDISREALALARETVPDAHLIQGDMTQLPITKEAVDGLTAYHAVFHVPRAQHPTVYREFARVLIPGGWLLMTLPGGSFETIRHEWMGGSMLFASPGRERTLAQLREAGFEEIETTVADDPLGSSTEFVFARRE